MTSLKDRIEVSNLDIKPKEPLSAPSESDQYNNESDNKVQKIKRTFINPSFAYTEEGRKNLLWFNLKAIPIYKVTNNVRAIDVSTEAYSSDNIRNALTIQLNKPLYYFKFLSSQEIMEQLSHSWEPYENWAAVLSQAYAEYGVVLPENLKGLASSLPSVGIDIMNALSNFVSSEGDLKKKASEALNSAVNTYLKANVDIILPYLFEIKTEPNDLIVVDLAVLKSVQPTWKGPWIGGYPSRCELRLSFMEYRPLEQRVFYGQKTENKIIQVIQKERPEGVKERKKIEEFINRGI